ncbi:universal stress protein [Marinomonas sp. PE14-40]|uniref:universal stress protein n=1 Tax=Marinomonas sp. PE14-40 TaxID=3060621 RepID=UPI003F6741A6
MITPKSLLMPLSTSGHINERLEGALSVANYFDGHLEVLHAQVSPRQFIPEGAIGIPTKLVRELESLAGKFSQSESQTLQTEFAKLCRKLDIKLSEKASSRNTTANWVEVNGLRSELVAEKGKVSDLVIIPQSKSGSSTATFEAAIMRSGKPVLLVPRTMTQFKADKVLIAWNASTEVARAISHALPILKRAQQVIITTGTRKGYRQPSPNELADYLKSHGINTIIEQFDNSHSATGEALMSFAKNHQSQLIIMGAYTRRRVREQIFGGVTRHMLAKSDLPIFMMH